MSFPKMIYRAAKKVADQKALEVALAAGAVQTLIVASVAEEAAAAEEGWTEDLASLVAPAKKAKAE